MAIFHDHIKAQLHSSLIKMLQGLGVETSGEELAGHWSLPPQREMGHLSFPCFPLAKTLRKSPAQIASELAESMAPEIDAQNFIREINPTGPYLNFWLRMETVAPSLLGKIASGDFFRGPFKTRLPKTMIEYFQPNTHKEVHVGHLRNLCLGLAMVKCHDYLGYPIVSATYPGDSGTHVAKVLWYLQREKPTPPEGDDLGEWLGTIYALANQALDKSKDGGRELADILKAIGEESGASFEQWQQTRQWSLDHIKKICHWAGVTFDHWYFESEVDIPSLEFARQLYEQGKLVKDDGAIMMKLEKEKLPPCLLIKRDGNGLYATKDLELARRKFEDYGIEKNIYVVDKRQSLHFKQVFKTLEKIGYEQAKNCYHLEYEFVELPDGAISSRKGNIISAQSFIDEMQQTIRENFLTRYEDWSSEEKNRVADQVAQGAIKYGMASVDSNKKIVFDMKSWLQLDGESGPYIQYAHARIQSLLGKISLGDDLSTCDWSQLQHPLEQSLVVELAQFNNVVESACDHYKTSLLTSYLYDLAKLFNSFYAQCPILKADGENLGQVRAHLAHKAGLVLAKGLELLGIPAPHKM